MRRSYVYVCILMLLRSVTAAHSQEEIPASSELDGLMYQTENDVDTGPGPEFGDPTDDDRDLGPGKDKSDESLLLRLMGAGDQQIRSQEDNGSKWATYYKPRLHFSPKKRLFAGLIELRSAQDKLRAQAEERKRMTSAGARSRADSAQQEWNARNASAASRQMVCYFKVCTWRG